MGQFSTIRSYLSPVYLNCFNVPLPGLLLFFHLFDSIDSKQMFNINLLMTLFEPWTTGTGSDGSAH